VTEPSSKGLIPQLSDVLRALTASQARLVVRVQDVRREHPDVMAAVAPHLHRNDPTEVVAPLGPADELHQPAVATPPHGERIESLRNEPQRERPLHNAAPASHSVPAVHAPFSGTRDTAAAAEAQEREDPNVRGQFEAATTKSYNFFDELDVQLAQVDESPRANST
jgi:hypothetical protein